MRRKAIIEFQLPDEEKSHNNAINANNMAVFIWDLEREIKNRRDAAKDVSETSFWLRVEQLVKKRIREEGLRDLIDAMNKQ